MLYVSWQATPPACWRASHRYPELGTRMQSDGSIYRLRDRGVSWRSGKSATFTGPTSLSHHGRLLHSTMLWGPHLRKLIPALPTEVT